MHVAAVAALLLSALYAALVWRQARGVNVVSFGEQLRSLVEGGSLERARSLCEGLAQASVGRTLGAVLRVSAEPSPEGGLPLADRLLETFERAHERELAALGRANLAAAAGLLLAAVVLVGAVRGDASPWRMAAVALAVGLVVWGGSSLTRVRRDTPAVFRALLPTLLIGQRSSEPPASEPEEAPEGGGEAAPVG